MIFCISLVFVAISAISFFILFIWALSVYFLIHLPEALSIFYPLQYCASLCHISTWISHRYVCVPPYWNSLPTPTPSHSSRLSRSPGLSVSDTAHPHWLSVLHVVMYTFPFYSLKSSHRLLSPLHPQVCSLCLHLHHCPGHRFVSNIFLDCIQRVNMQYLSFFFWFPSLCTVGSRFIHFVKIAGSWFLWSSTYFVSIF